MVGTSGGLCGNIHSGFVNHGKFFDLLRTCYLSRRTLLHDESFMGKKSLSKEKTNSQKRKDKIERIKNCSQMLVKIKIPKPFD